MKPIPTQHHHDGFGLNDLYTIEADDRDPNAGNASHVYEVLDENFIVDAFVLFQHGRRDEPDSLKGILDAALVAILIDRYEGFQSGPFACEENEAVLDHLRAALDLMKARAAKQAARGVLGTSKA